MASSVLGRISGSVLSVPPAREYTFPAGHERAGEKLTFEKVNVLVADMNVTAVDLPRRDNTGTFENLYTREFSKGEQVDFLVEISIYRGDLQARVLGLWPLEQASYLTAATSDAA
jgi:hypothetical protein